MGLDSTRTEYTFDRQLIRGQPPFDPGTFWPDPKRFSYSKGKNYLKNWYFYRKFSKPKPKMADPTHHYCLEHIETVWCYKLDFSASTQLDKLYPLSKAFIWIWYFEEGAAWLIYWPIFHTVNKFIIFVKKTQMLWINHKYFKVAQKMVSHCFILQELFLLSTKFLFAWLSGLDKLAAMKVWIYPFLPFWSWFQEGVVIWVKHFFPKD